jgi:hypothetical protein
VLFASAIKLHYSKADVPRHFKIPGKTLGVWVVCLLGMLSCLAVLLLGFIPSKQVEMEQIWLYELILVGGMVISCALPLWISRKKV